MRDALRILKNSHGKYSKLNSNLRAILVNFKLIQINLMLLQNYSRHIEYLLSSKHALISMIIAPTKKSNKE